ncbi:MAG: M20/M25/M40 family metallo-hydrolase, partial [Lachnospiraceae bacterium]|nr:M20/M25/M40 family metallo-hydrolase [Lachnospiraceae bacterium]
MIILMIFLAAVSVLAVLLLIAVIHTLLVPRETSTYRPDESEESKARALAYAKKLSAMVRYETVSHPNEHDVPKIEGFHEVLKGLFPLVFEKLEVTDIEGNLLLYWKGKKHGRPLVLMSHQDVVPAGGKWEHEPFSGDIADGKVWGRGASDTKCSVMGFFQAVEELLEKGYEPEQ